MCRDIAPEGDDLKETNANLDQLTDLALELQQKTGVKLLWATCNLFSNPRYLKLFLVILFTPWRRCSWAQFSTLTAPPLTLSRKCGKFLEGVVTCNGLVIAIQILLVKEAKISPSSDAVQGLLSLRMKINELWRLLLIRKLCCYQQLYEWSSHQP